MVPQIKEWMSGDPVSVESEASALEALELMLGRGIRHLPVLDDGRRVVGVLSLDDLRAALPIQIEASRPLEPSERDAAREWRVAEIMAQPAETLGEDADLSEAADRMAARRIGCLPIVDAEGHLVGLLSETDALHALAAASWSEGVIEGRGEQTSGDASSSRPKGRA